MKQDVIRSSLIDATVRVVSREGLDKATTKRLAQEAGLNEVYIYRSFESKEDLFVKTFEALDRELIDKVLEHLPIMSMTQLPIEDRCRMFFMAVWKFLLRNSQKCLCFIRYYYSPYFKQYSAVGHRRAFRPLIEQFAPAFRQGANTWLLLNHILDAMLSSAVKVFDGEMPDDQQTAGYVFDLVYCSLELQLSWKQKAKQ